MKIIVDSLQVCVSLTVWLAKEIPYLSLAPKTLYLSSREIEADIELDVGASNLDTNAFMKFQNLWTEYKNRMGDSTCLTCRHNGHNLSGREVSELLQKHGFDPAQIFGSIDKNIHFADSGPVRRESTNCVDTRELLEALIRSCLVDIHDTQEH